MAEDNNQDTGREPIVGRIFWWLVAGAAMFAVGLGVWGFSVLYPPTGNVFSWQWHAENLNNFYRTMLLFTLEGNYEKFPTDSWQLHVARFLAPISTIAAIVRILIAAAYREVVQFEIRFLHGHVVIIGLGELGRQIAIASNKSGASRIVAIEIGPEDLHESFCRAHGVVMLSGSGMHDSTLKRASVHRARKVFVTTGSDVTNLEIAVRVREFTLNVATASSILGPVVECHVSDLKLAQQLRNIGQSVQSINQFNVFTLAARNLLTKYPIYSYADLMAQDRVHAAIFGLGRMGESILIQIALQCHYKDFRRPLISILDRDIETTRQRLRARYPYLEEACDLAFFEIDVELVDPRTCEALRNTEADAPVTAAFFCFADQNQNLAAALGIRRIMRSEHRFLAPLFVRMSTSGGVHRLVTPPERSRLFADVLQPFGLFSEMLIESPLISDRGNATAEMLHDAYREQTGKALSTAGNEEQLDEWRQHPANRPWADLPETYREANRRAADHARVKLASADFVVPTDPNTPLRLGEGSGFAASRDQRDMLARLEHARWCADRYLDGWRHAEHRDNDRYLHPLLIPYDSLPPEEQQKDVDQVCDLRDRFLRTDRDEPVTVWPEYTIGVLGFGDMTSEQESWLTNELNQNVLPTLRKMSNDFYITLLSPIGTTAEVCATEVLFAYFAGSERIRLIAPMGAPHDQVMGSQSSDVSSSGHSSRESEASDPVVATTQERISTLTLRCEWVVDLVPPGIFPAEIAGDPAGSRHLRERTIAYIVERSDVLIIVQGNANNSEEELTAMTVTWRADPVNVPANVSILSPAQRFLRQPSTDCIHIDAMAEKVVSHFREDTGDQATTT